MKILVVDDDEVIRTFVERVIEHASHDAVLAEDGADALAMINKVDPDMLITDMRMPRLDGFGLVEAVKKSPRFKNMPVICLSSVNQRDDVTRMIELGVSDYVLKPVKPGELAERIRAVGTKLVGRGSGIGDRKS